MVKVVQCSRQQLGVKSGGRRRRRRRRKKKK